MSLASLVHKTVHDLLVNGSEAALQAYIGQRVYDRVPTDPQPRYPYVVIDDIEVRDDANTCSNASEVHITVRVITSPLSLGAPRGTIQAKEIGGLVREILAPDDPDDVPFISDYLVSFAAFDAEVYRPGDDPLLTEGVLTFTYAIDPAPIVT